VRKPQPFYLPQLDGMRFFAFFSVFIWHFMTPWASAFVANPDHSGVAKIAAQSLVVGGNGVDLFFTLSAY
jgi:peptidoglycan/LPS O-acetylase OafA/YrhL